MPQELNALREQLLEHVRKLGAATDPLVVDALRTVPRHLFLPDLSPSAAYQDDAIVTKRDAAGQPTSSSSQPTIMAIMLDQLGLARGHRVLEIGAGTGFNAGLLAHIVGPSGAVTSIDLDEDIVERAKDNLDAAGSTGVTVLAADGALGYSPNAPYDRIIATVGVWDLAQAWLDQLGPDGRLVVPLDLRGVQRSVAFERDGDRWVSRSARPCGFMRMRGTLAGPEQLVVLDKENNRVLSLPYTRDVDSEALAAVLTETPETRRTGLSPTMSQLFDGLALWLAVHEPRWCSLGESATATPSLLPGAPLRAGDATMTAGILGDDGMALLGSVDGELTVLGYGNEEIAGELVAHVLAWDAAGRPDTSGLRLEAYPSGVPGGAGDVVIEKRNCRLHLSW